jgi:hypothetical protein
VESYLWLRIGARVTRKTQEGQRKSRETDAEFVQRCASRYGLSQIFCQFIEFVIHNFPFLKLLLKLLARAYIEIISSETARPVGDQDQCQAVVGKIRRAIIVLGVDRGPEIDWSGPFVAGCCAR